MILNDLITEYQTLKDNLKLAENFYNTSLSVIDFYNSEFSKVTQTYYTSSANNPREQLSGNLSKLFSGLFSMIGKLNSTSRGLYKCIGVLSNTSFKSSSLQNDIDLFISSADASIDSLYNIIENQLDSSKKQGFFYPLIKNLHIFTTQYNSLLKVEWHISKFKKILYEPLPEHIQKSENYSEFAINSLVTSNSFEDLSGSISSFGELYNGISRLLELPTSDRYYIRKVETGSLVIVITSTTVSLLALGKFIDFCVKKYIEYRKAGLEIKSMRQQIATTDLAMAEKVLELNPNLENKAELLAKASESAFRYFKLNPKFKIGDTLYDTGEVTPLITDSSSTTTSNSNENE